MGGDFTGKIGPQWDLIETARLDCNRFVENECGPGNMTYKISTVLRELLENAIKHTTVSCNDSCILYSVSITKEKVVIEIINPLDKREEQNLVKLDKTIQWIRGFQNPLEVYIKKIQEISALSFNESEVDGLGLARIAYEAECFLDFYVTTGNAISVSAILRRQKERNMEQMSKEAGKIPHKLLLNLEHEDNALMILFSGSGIARNPGVELFKQLNGEILEEIKKNHKIIVDVKNVEYCNASTLSFFARLMKWIVDSEGEGELQYDKTVNWQEIIFAPFMIFEASKKNNYMEKEDNGT